MTTQCDNGRVIVHVQFGFRGIMRMGKDVGFYEDVNFKQIWGKQCKLTVM